MSGYQPQNRLYHYKSYCKYSLLYGAVMGCTKDVNEVTKSLKSLIVSLHAAGKQQKDITSHVGCSKISVSHVINAVALKGWAACETISRCRVFELHKMVQGRKRRWQTEEDHPTRWQTALPDCQDLQVLVNHSTLPKVKLCFGARPPFVIFGRWASVAANLQQNSCLTKHKLKRLQWSNIHKDA